MTVKTPMLTLLAVCALGISVAPASAEPTTGTGWEAYSQAFPANLAPGGSGIVQLDIFNIGAKRSEGAVTVTDTLPAGLVATKAGGLYSTFSSNGAEPLSPEEEKELGAGHNAAGEKGARWDCTGNGSGKATLTGATMISCTSNPEFLPSLPMPYSAAPAEADVTAERLGIAVKVAEGAPEGVSANQMAVAGGGAAAMANASDPVTISSSEPGFGLPDWDVWFSNADGSTDTQAGSHPYEATFVNAMGSQLADGQMAEGNVRDLESHLPAGFFGDPNSVPRCTREQLDAELCPASSQIGIDGVGFAGNSPGTGELQGFPVYNMVPPKGVPDEFAFSLAGYDTFFDAGVRSGRGYPIVEHIDDIAEVGEDLNVLTLWGVPGEESHNPQRCGGVEVGGNGAHELECGVPGVSSHVTPKPFLTLPTSCEGPQAFTLRGTSTWTDENVNAEKTVLTHDNAGTETGFTGCEKLSLLPTFSAVPDTAFADTPAGLTAEVKIPQENLELPNGLVPATLKNTSVTLPEGLVINPGQAAGLVACQAAEANLEGEGPQHCPNASKVGTDKIQTPLLEEQLETELVGDVYVLQSNPPELKLLVAASADGIYLKLVGTVHLNTQTGQLTTTFDETPALPFTNFKLGFSGGAQAALATPTQCGSYSTSSDFTPWTTPFAADVLGTDGFSIASGPLGAPCASSPLPFHPSLIAGATTDQAGGFTDFTLLLQRGDDQQRIEKLQFKAPEGLVGDISHVTPCPEPQAGKGECTAASQIGHTTVASGTGPYPLIVPEPGRGEAPIYLTGPYEGAPFGLSIVTPVLAGPFNLGTIITRAKIEVDPHTAQITVTTDPLPQIIDGVPTDLRTVNSVIDRPEFMFNPSNCSPSSFSGTATGTPPPGAGGPGATAPISSPFQVGSCRSLEFTPKFTASTTSKDNFNDNGASLVTKVTYPNVPQGSQSDIARVKVELPIALPSRLTTLQKACVAKVFEADPANCPSASVIGHAVVHTPLLPVPLEGPAIFVSHGGEAFPSVIIVLQGDNVTIELVGTTYISHAGITSTTFKVLPDAPFSSFELNLPTGKFSALASNTNICKPTRTEMVKKKVSVKRHGKRVKVTKRVSEAVATPLEMGTEIIGQNGAEIHENTKIAVTGCQKTTVKKAAKKKKKKGKKKGKGKK